MWRWFFFTLLSHTSTPVSIFRFIDLDQAAVVFVPVAYFFDTNYPYLVSVPSICPAASFWKTNIWIHVFNQLICSYWLAICYANSTIIFVAAFISLFTNNNNTGIRSKYPYGRFCFLIEEYLQLFMFFPDTLFTRCYLFFLVNRCSFVI